MAGLGDRDDVRRILWHCDEPLVFLDDPQVPADNSKVKCSSSLAPGGAAGGGKSCPVP
jgi:hypothetical protein